jgi:hypothetical protein
MASADPVTCVAALDLLEAFRLAKSNLRGRSRMVGEVGGQLVIPEIGCQPRKENLPLRDL